MRLLRGALLLLLLVEVRLGETVGRDCVPDEAVLLRCVVVRAAELLLLRVGVVGRTLVFARVVCEAGLTALLLGAVRDVFVERLLDIVLPLLVRVAGAACWRAAGCVLVAGRCTAEEVLRVLVVDLVFVAGLAALFRLLVALGAWRTSLVPVLLRAVTAPLRARSAVLVALLRPAVAVAAVRVLAADLTVAASETRAGRAEVRVLRSTSGRYKLTERSFTAALPGRLALLISLTATLLRVTRSISLRPGPLTYVRLL